MIPGTKINYLQIDADLRPHDPFDGIPDAEIVKLFLAQLPTSLPKPSRYKEVGIEPGAGPGPEAPVGEPPCPAEFPPALLGLLETKDREPLLDQPSPN